MLSGVVTVMSTGFGSTGVMITAFLFGFTSFPIYSVAAAHAHDFADDFERVELSASLMFFCALGAIAAPYGASVLINASGPSALFVLIASAHALLVIFGLIRMLARPTPSDKTDYIYTPRTSFIVGRLNRRKRRND